jgi:formate dehydrogenase subunit gamma
MRSDKESDDRTVRRFGKRAMAIHWVHAASFLVLAVTGAIIFIHGSGFSDFDIAKILHRAAAVIFILIPVSNYFLDPRASAGFVKETFKWDRDDIKWIVAAPDYYFGGSEEKMLPQSRLNTGQKLWQAIVIVTASIFVITGIALWSFKLNLSISAYQWFLFIHGCASLIVGTMFLLHIYLGIFHPRFRESFRSMLDGRITPSYARSHYRKWYDKLS